MRYSTVVLLLFASIFAFGQDIYDAAVADPAASYAPAKQIDTSRFSQAYIDQVGGKLSVGIAFDEGFGVPVRYYWTPKNIVEAGMYLGTSVVIQEEGNDDFEFYLPSGPMFGIAYTRLGEKFEKAKKRKSKIRALGVTPRFYYQFPAGSENTFSKARFSVGFTQETYKGPQHRRNYVFEIGPYYSVLNGSFEGLDFTGPEYGIYLRFNWNWFLE